MVFVAAVTLVLQALGIALLPAGAMLDFRSWSIGMSALPLVVFVLSLPSSVACLVLLAHIALVLVAPMVRPELTFGLVPFTVVRSCAASAPAPCRSGPEGPLRRYLLARIDSNTPGSSNVEVSPSSRPSATSRSNRRMILPLRVFGSSGTT